ncbi:solute carrier organic anion transporter family member 1C1-like [Megalops cyprinoides]|uniref:solute carrier organic anion transporter family member 1C1-like n=1 Tax=Megalops cyprinoides TaxID=118141 RepID=UPI0018641D4C|nr:solute carrier organic anion transporter family member 1C1-like [Megalops cyprinoides]
MRADAKKQPEPCCSKLKLFLASLSFVYFAKAFQGSYMKSSITQIERRFDIPSSLIGVIDGSFEIGNLLVIAFVSYFGARLHRPRLIGAGCLFMAAGSIFTALPHFFQGRYQYETTVTQPTGINSTESVHPCLANQSQALNNNDLSLESVAACEKEAGSSMWIYVFLGNMLRGIGETPVMPLGVSYLDDFAREENTAFYLACIQTVGIVGPMFGFLLGSFCAKLYVDIGAVDLETVSINHKDSRWVGAWWLGFLATGAVMLLAGVPFWFLPKSLPKQGEENSQPVDDPAGEQDHFIPESTAPAERPRPVTFSELAKDFLPSLRRLFSNTVFLLIICVSLVQVNGFIGMITFKPKFMEQVYGQSPSKAIFLIGVMNLPAVALGIITGGFVMKRFKLSVLGAARMSVSASILSFLSLLIQYFLQCENSQVAGLTVSYQGLKGVSYQPETLLSQCNMECSCSLKHWDPVCASNGITYASPCLAGCQSSSGSGKGMVFHNCTCMDTWPVPAANTSAILGQCPRQEDCDRMFKYYMAVSVVGAFVSACGATPGYIVLLRSIQQDLKSLALGMHILIVRTLGGIPPPIYFGALIDRTCLKWGSKRCGGRGACRLYDSSAFRVTFLGLIYGLYSMSYLLWIVLYAKLVQRQKKLAMLDQAKAGGQEGDEINISNGKTLSEGNLKSEKEQEKESTI